MLEGIKQWAFTLVITAIIGGLANSFTISENGSMKKYVKFACSAVALAVMIMPLKGLFTEMPNFFDFTANSNIGSEYHDYDDYNEEHEENIDRISELTVLKTNELLKERINDIVYEKSGIKPEDVFIYIGYEKQNDSIEMKVEKIKIEMPENTDRKKMGEIKSYIRQLFNCEVDTGE